MPPRASEQAAAGAGTLDVWNVNGEALVKAIVPRSETIGAAVQFIPCDVASAGPKGAVRP